MGKFVLEYSIEKDELRTISLDELMMKKVSDEWIIVSIDEKKDIDSIYKAILKQKKSFAKFHENMRNDVAKYNKFALKTFLKDEANELADELSKNPSPEKLAELMGIQKSLISINENKHVKRHLSLVKDFNEKP